MASTSELLLLSSMLNNILFNGNYEFIDLTHSFDNQTVYWPNARNFSFIKKVERESPDGESWFAANDFAAGEHGGTHIDAPYHFWKEGIKVGDIPVDKLIVPLIIADVSQKVRDNPDFVLRKADLDLDHMINNFGNKPILIIFKFGWSKFFIDRNEYLGLKEGSDELHFPGLSAEVAEWITSSCNNIVGIGVDVASVDPGSASNDDRVVHKALSRTGLYIIENVKFSTAIPEYGCTALALPMKIQEGTGAPLRLVAICPKLQPKNNHGNTRDFYIHTSKVSRDQHIFLQ